MSSSVNSTATNSTASTASTATTSTASKACRNFSRFVRKSLKPVIFKLSRKLSVTYWPERRRTISAMLIALLTPFIPGFAHAAPTGAQVVAGSASVNQLSKLTTQITQSSQNAIINWQSFSIGASEAVKVMQPGASSVLLNRVIGSDPSRIFGSLSANGQVFLVNNAGVYFAPGASVNVGGLVASSLNLSDANFLAGKYQFDAGANAAAVSNYGQLAGGYVVLSAPQVTNAGSISAPSGGVALAAGGRVNLAIAGDQLVSLSVDASVANAAIVNSGSISADGGKVFMTARSSSAVLDTVINTSGIVRANAIVSRNGEIIIDGGPAGVVAIKGTLSATALDAGGVGGVIKVLGDKVGLFAGASVDVSGDIGGGTVLIGGNFHGAGPEANAAQTVVQQGATINADAITSGNGGNVAVWADGHTSFAGSISAKGGAQSGDGGFVETSGKGTLDFTGDVNTSAAKGKTGTLLLDPSDITITDNSSATMVNNGGVFSDTGAAKSSNLSASTLEAALVNGNVSVDTASSGAGAGAITVAAPVSWNSNLLTLKASTNININASLNASGNASLALQYGQGAVASGNRSTYNVNAVVNLSAGNHFSTMMGSDGAIKNYTVITSLGAMGSTTAADLQGMNGNFSANYALGRNIDASATAVWNSVTGFTPIGNSSQAYAGSFDGLGHSVNNIFINLPNTNYSSLFGNTSSSSLIQNVALVDSSIKGFNYVGGLVGYNNGIVNHSFATGSVSGDGFNVGGLVGVNLGTITNSYATGSVSATIGGGLVGQNNGTINNSYATANVSGNGNDGGLAGVNRGTINNSYATGSVGGSYSGGLVGWNNSGTINNSYATGHLTGSTDVGGLVGQTQNAYVNNSYWNIETSGQATSAGGTGLTATQMQAASSFTGFNIANTSGSGKVWRIYEGQTAPLLASFLTSLTLGDSVLTYNGVSQSGTLSSLSGVSSASGRNVGSYAAYSNQQGYDITGGNLTITRLDSVTWVGNSTGNWSQASNWAGNAIPDLANVKQVIIPAGKSVTFDANVGTNGSVQLDAISSSGALAVSSGNLTVAGNLASSSYTQTGGVVSAGSLTAASSFHQTDGNLLVSGNVGITQASGALVLGNASMASLNVTANGDILQNSATALTVSGATTLAAGANNISLSNVGNDFGGSVTVTGGATSLTAMHGLSLNGSVTGNLTTQSAALNFGATSVTGNLTATAGGAISQSASLSVGGSTHIDAGSQTVTLNNPGNTLVGAVTLASAQATIFDHIALTAHLTSTGTTTLTSANNLTVDGSATGDLVTKSAGLIFGATSVTGNLNASATSAVSQSAAVNVAGNSVISASGQAVMLSNPGNDFGSVLTVTGAATKIVDANTLLVHLNTTGDTSISTGINDLTIDGSTIGNLSTHSAALVFGATSVTGDLSGTATGAVSQSGVVSVTGASNIAAAGQSVTLTNSGNVFGGAMTIASAATQITDASALTAHLSTTGPTSLISANGMNVDGSVSGNLDTQSVALNFGATTVSGNLLAAATGSISQSGVLSVAGASNIAAAGHGVTLNNAGNDFGGALTVAGAATQIVDVNALTAHLNTTGATSVTSVNGLTVDGSATGNLTTKSGALNFGAMAVTGDLTANANGAVTQNGILSVSGASTIAAAGQSVTLNNAGNDFVGALTVSGAATQIADKNALTAHLNTTGATSVTSGTGLAVDGSVAGTLTTKSAALNFAPTAVTGDLNVSASGAVSQSGVLSVTGASNIAAAGQSVTLNNAGNDFGGALTLASAATQIADTNALTAHLNTTGVTSITSGNGLMVDGSVAGDLTTQSAALNFGATSVTGNLSATAFGAVSQSGILSVSGASNIAAGGQSVMLNNAGNDFVGALTVAGAATQIADMNGLMVHLNTIGATSVTSVNGLIVDGSVAGNGNLTTSSGALNFGATTVAGNLNTVASGAVSQSGVLTVAGASNIAATGQSVTLNKTGNDFGGALTIASAATQIADKNALTAHLNTTGATSVTSVSGLIVDGSVAGNLTTSSGALSFGATTVAGNLMTTASGAVSQSGALSVSGASTIAAAGHSVTLNSVSNDLGGALTITGAATQVMDANALTAHLTTTGPTSLTSVNGLTVDGSVAGNLATKSGALSFGATAVTGDLSVTAAGAISQAGVVSVTGASNIAAAGQNVTLANSGNVFGGAITIASAATQITDASALTAHLSTTGPTSLISANGMNVDGSVTGNLGTQSAALNFGATTVTGNLMTTASGAVSQSDALTVTGTSNIAAAGHGVTLNNAGNDFGGALTVAGAATQIVDVNALTAHLNTTGATSVTSVNGLTVDGSATGNLTTKSGALNFGAMAVTGDLTANANGAVTQNGILSVSGASTIAAAGQSVTLNNAGNDFGGALTVAGAATQIADMNGLTAHLNTTGATSVTSVNGLTVDGRVSGNLTTKSAALNFAPTAVTGDLNVTASGAVSQSGVLSVTGASNIAAAGQSVTLNNSGNDFGGALTLASAETHVTDANALTAHLNTTGVTSITSGNGLMVDGSVAGDLTTQSAALNFGATSVTGNLSATASGAVSQSGVLTVAGASTITAAGQSVTLNNASNDFGGALTVAGATTQITDMNGLTAHLSTTGATSITSANGLMVDGSVAGNLTTKSDALTFGATAVTGDLNASASGAVSQSGNLSVTGASNIAAAGQSVTLTNAGNDFGGALTLASAATQIVDVNALTAHLNTTGATSITSGNGLVVDGSVAGILTTSSGALNFGATAVTGNLMATASGAVSQSGVLSVAGASNITATGQSVTLANPANIFGGALTVASAATQIADAGALTAHLNTTGDTSLTSGNGMAVDGAVSGTLSTQSAALNFGATTVTGNLNATASGAVGQSGALTVAGASNIAAAGQSVILNNAGNDFVGALTVAGAATQIEDVNALTAHLNATGATSLISGTGLTVDGSVTGNLTTSSGALNFGATTVAGNLNAAAKGAVGQNGALNVSGASNIAAAGQSVTLNNAGNDFGGALTIASAAAQITDMNALTAHLNTTGATSIISGTGLVVDGSVAGNLTSSSGALNFGATSVTGNLSATASGAVGQSDVLTVTGASTIAAAGQSVMLNNAGNDFVGALTVAGAATRIADMNGLTAHLNTTGATSVTSVNGLTVDGSVAGNLTTKSAALDFAPTAVTGDLNVTASGAVSQSGVLTVAGASNIAAAGQNVTLNNPGNDFGGALTVASAETHVADMNALTVHLNTTGATGITSGNGLMVDGSVTGNLTTSSGALNFGATAVNGNLMAAASGAVSQSGVLNVAGASNIAATGQSVMFANPANMFGGALTVAGAATQIADAGALTAHLNTTGATSVASVNRMTVDGSVSASLTTKSGALDFGATAVAGDLTASATGAVSQRGALAVAGASIIDAPGQSVVLANPANVFGGAMTIASAGLQIVDQSALTVHLTSTGDASLASSAKGVTVDGSVAGNLNITAQGDISQSAPLNVIGSTSVDAGVHAVNLANELNDFVGAVSATGSSVAVHDSNILTLGQVNAVQADLFAQTTLQEASGGDVNADKINISLGAGGTSIGAINKVFNVKPGSAITFGASMPVVSAYFSGGSPVTTFKYDNAATENAYNQGKAWIFQGSHLVNDDKLLGLNGSLDSSIAQVLQMIRKRVASFADEINRGMPVNLAEQVAYPHSGSLKLKTP